MKYGGNKGILRFGNLSSAQLPILMYALFFCSHHIPERLIELNNICQLAGIVPWYSGQQGWLSVVNTLWNFPWRHLCNLRLFWQRQIFTNCYQMWTIYITSFLRCVLFLYTKHINSMSVSCQLADVGTNFTWAEMWPVHFGGELCRV